MERTFNNVHDVLHFIQKTLKAHKAQYNTHGKYHYRSCEDIVEAVKSIMPEGATLTLHDDVIAVPAEESLLDENNKIRKTSSARIYIKATAILSWGGQSVANTALAREDYNRKGMDSAQLTGATSSYARKYALNGLFMIDDTKDADATNDHGKNDPKPENKPKEEPKPKTPQVEFLETCKRELEALNDIQHVTEWQQLPKVKEGMKDLNLKQVTWLQDQINAAMTRLNPLNAG